jgi:hypothetical protein
LSSTIVTDLRRKNETKNNTGVKLLIRNKNKYESKPLNSDPREIKFEHEGSEEGGSEEEEFDYRDYDNSSSGEEEQFTDELNEYHK